MGRRRGNQNTRRPLAELFALGLVVVAVVAVVSAGGVQRTCCFSFSFAFSFSPTTADFSFSFSSRSINDGESGSKLLSISAV